MGAHLQRYPSTALHCTPHFPTVNASNVVIGSPFPLKPQVGAVERSGGKRGGRCGGQGKQRGARGAGGGEESPTSRVWRRRTYCSSTAVRRGTLRGPGHPAGLVVRVSAFEEATWYWTPDGKRVAPSMIWC